MSSSDEEFFDADETTPRTRKYLKPGQRDNDVVSLHLSDVDSPNISGSEDDELVKLKKQEHKLLQLKRTHESRRRREEAEIQRRLAQIKRQKVEESERQQAAERLAQEKEEQEKLRREESILKELEAQSVAQENESRRRKLAQFRQQIETDQSSSLCHLDRTDSDQSPRQSLPDTAISSDVKKSSLERSRSLSKPDDVVRDIFVSSSALDGHNSSFDDDDGALNSDNSCVFITPNGGAALSREAQYVFNGSSQSPSQTRSEDVSVETLIPSSAGSSGSCSNPVSVSLSNRMHCSAGEGVVEQGLISSLNTQRKPKLGTQSKQISFDESGFVEQDAGMDLVSHYGVPANVTLLPSSVVMQPPVSIRQSQQAAAEHCLPASDSVREVTSADGQSRRQENYADNTDANTTNPDPRSMSRVFTGGAPVLSPLERQGPPVSAPSEGAGSALVVKSSSLGLTGFESSTPKDGEGAAAPLLRGGTGNNNNVRESAAAARPSSLPGVQREGGLNGITPKAPPRKKRDSKRIRGSAGSASPKDVHIGLPPAALTPQSTVQDLTRDFEKSLSFSDATSGLCHVTALDRLSVSSNSTTTDASDLRPSSLPTGTTTSSTGAVATAGKRMTDEQILQTVIVRNLDTGETIALADVPEVVPEADPLSLHIMKITKEYSIDKGEDTDDSTVASSTMQSAQKSIKKGGVKIKRLLGKSVKKMKSVADDVLQKEEAAPAFMEPEEPTADDKNVLKGRASGHHKGPYSFPEVRFSQELQGEQTGGGPVWVMKFSPCGRLLAAGGQDSVIRVWVLKDAFSYFDDMRKKYDESKLTPGSSSESVHTPQHAENESPLGNDETVYKNCESDSKSDSQQPVHGGSAASSVVSITNEKASPSLSRRISEPVGPANNDSDEIWEGDDRFQGLCKGGVINQSFDELKCAEEEEEAAAAAGVAEGDAGSSNGDEEETFFLSKPFMVYKGHTADVLDLSWSKNYFVLSSSMDKTVRLWHISRRECLCCFQHIDFVTAIAFHPKDDRYFLSGSLDGKVRLWSIPEKKVALWNEVNSPPSLITAVNFCQNGKFAVMGTYDGRCIFFNTEQLKYYTQINVRSTRGKNSKGSKITGIEPLPHYEDKILVTSNDSRLRLYDLRDLTLTCKYRGHSNCSSQIKASFSHDGRFIVCGSEDQNIYVWKTYHDHTKLTARRDRNDCWESIKVRNAVVTAAIFAPKPNMFFPSASNQSSKSESLKSSGSSSKGTWGRSAGRTNSMGKGSGGKTGSLGRRVESLGHVLLTADYTGAIQILLRKNIGKKKTLAGASSPTLQPVRSSSISQHRATPSVRALGGRRLDGTPSFMRPARPRPPISYRDSAPPPSRGTDGKPL